MGQEIERSVISHEFAALTMEPQAIYELGREDLTTDRPGQILISEVRKFQAQGGFRQLQEIRDREAGIELQKDSFIGKRNLGEFSLKNQTANSPNADLKNDGQAE